MRLGCRLGGAIALLYLAGISNSVAEPRKGLPWSGTPPLGDLDAYVPSIEKAVKTRDPNLIPLLFIAFRHRESYDGQGGVSKYHWALLRGILLIGGDEGRTYSRKIVDAYLEEASARGWRVVLGDREFLDITTTFLKEMGSIADDEVGKWALRIFNDRSMVATLVLEHIAIRESAYYCYLSSVLKQATNVDDKADLLLKDFRTPGPYCRSATIVRAMYYDRNLQDSVIQDGARQRHLLEIGEPALPRLLAAWQGLMTKDRRTVEDDLYQYALAHVVNAIRHRSPGKPFEPLPEGPAAMSEDEMHRKMAEWDRAEGAAGSSSGGSGNETNGIGQGQGAGSAQPF